MGTNKEVNANEPKKDLEIIKAKATKCPDFQIDILNGANHNYFEMEKELSEFVLHWLKGRF